MLDVWIAGGPASSGAVAPSARPAVRPDPVCEYSPPTPEPAERDWELACRRLARRVQSGRPVKITVIFPGEANLLQRIVDGFQNRALDLTVADMDVKALAAVREVLAGRGSENLRVVYLLAGPEALPARLQLAAQDLVLTPDLNRKFDAGAATMIRARLKEACGENPPVAETEAGGAPRHMSGKLQ